MSFFSRSPPLAKFLVCFLFIYALRIHVIRPDKPGTVPELGPCPGKCPGQSFVTECPGNRCKESKDVISGTAPRSADQSQSADQ